MIADLTTPHFQLPFEELPRGFVPFPQRILDGVEQQQQKWGIRFTAERLREQLEIETLAYYYLDYPVAYRSVPEGLEVLGVGDAEVARFWRNPEEGVQVVEA
jgi:hypothetical protein